MMIVIFSHILLKKGAKYYTINYKGNLRPYEDSIQDCSMTSHSLALESILMIGELARRNEVDELYDIKEYLERKI